MDKLNLTEKQVRNLGELGSIGAQVDITEDWLVMRAEIDTWEKLGYKFCRAICKKQDEIDRLNRALQETMIDVKAWIVDTQEWQELKDIFEQHFPELKNE
jgi:hypothetical protein